MRTIKELRENHEGKLYVYCANEEQERKFLEDAEREGFTFGRIDPTESHPANIIAIGDGLRLAHVSTNGRIAYQTGKVIRIDYGKYIAGEGSYII